MRVTILAVFTSRNAAPAPRVDGHTLVSNTGSACGLPNELRVLRANQQGQGAPKDHACERLWDSHTIFLSEHSAFWLINTFLSIYMGRIMKQEDPGARHCGLSLDQIHFSGKSQKKTKQKAGAWGISWGSNLERADLPQDEGLLTYEFLSHRDFTQSSTRTILLLEKSPHTFASQKHWPLLTYSKTRWFIEEGCLLPRLLTWVLSQEPTEWKRKPDSPTLSSDFHMYAIAYMLTCARVCVDTHAIVFF